MNNPNYDRGYHAFQNKLKDDLFGGEIRIERDKEFVEMPDGRKIPFSLLSSGQQELLPLWMVLEFLSTPRPDFREMLYIEEPEAHLFPNSQAELIAFLAMSATRGRRLFITTQSPYVLAKFNTLIKAGILAKQLGKNFEPRIAKIINRRMWLNSGQLKAYAFVNNKLLEIIDENGMIDGEYLDHVSETLSHEFDSLLEIEFGHVH